MRGVKLMVHQKILYKIDKILDHFVIEGYSDPIVFVEQFVCFLIMRESNRVFRREIYNNEIDWAKIQELYGNELVRYLKEYVFPNIRKISDRYNIQFSQEPDLVITKSEIIEEFVDLIDTIYIDMRDKEDFQIVSEVFELILERSISSSTHGQFFTSRHLIKTIINMVEPGPGNHIFDPACGTGGFLIEAFKYVTQNQNEVKRNCELTGHEINSRIATLAQVNLNLHEISANVRNIDALSGLNETYDVIVSSPPVGGIVDRSNRSHIFETNAKSSQLLFMELIMKSLKLYGRCGILVPEGFLFGNSAAHLNLRKQLVEEFNIDGIVSLPNGVFLPYTNAKLSILFFTKKAHESKPNTEKIWFFNVNNDGFTLDRKRVPTNENDLPDLLEKWGQREEDWERWLNNENSWEDKNIWFANYDEIKKAKYNLSAANYRPHQKTSLQYESPINMLNEILSIEKKIIKQVEELIRETETYD